VSWVWKDFGINNLQLEKRERTHLERPSSDEPTECRSSRQPPSGDSFDRDKGEILVQHRFIDVVTARACRRPDESRRDRGSDRCGEEGEPARQMRLSVADELVNAVRNALKDVERGLPRFFRSLTDLEAFFEDEVLKD
jgi:hypothetical protein